MAFSFQNLSLWTELHSKFSEFISLTYLSKELKILMLLSKIAPVSFKEVISYSSLMFPFRIVSIIFNSLLSIMSSRQPWLFSIFLKIIKATLVIFSLETFWSMRQMFLIMPTLGRLMKFYMALSLKDIIQTLSKV